MAAITDKFNRAANGTGVYPSLATVTATRETGGSVLTCDDLAGWATDTAVHFSTYRLMADGTVDTSSQSDWKGIVSGNTITQMTRLAGKSDSGHLVGDKVELNPTIGWLDDLVTGLLKVHNQDGSLKNNVVQTKNVNWATLEKFQNSGTKSNVGSDEVILSTYTVPNDGKYIIDVGTSTNITGATKHIFHLALYLNNEKLWDQGIASIANYAGNNGICLGKSFTTDMSKNDTLTLKARVLNATTAVNWDLNINRIW